MTQYKDTDELMEFIQSIDSEEPETVYEIGHHSAVTQIVDKISEQPCIDLQLKTADDWLWLAQAIAVDYDGFSTPEDLMGLIDEMSEYIGNARQLLKENKDV